MNESTEGTTAAESMSGEREADKGPEGWVDRHGDGLYRYALLRLRAPELAADLVQETFLQALRARGAFEGRSNERTWLVGILRHKILDHFRKSGRDRTRFEPAPTQVHGHATRADSPFDQRGHWRIGPASWGGDPSKQMEAQEFWEVFGGCLSKLPAGLADAFFLRELDGFDTDEIQSVLGISPANLWTRLYRARSLLRDCLETRWFGGRRPLSSLSPHAVTKGPTPP